MEWITVILISFSASLLTFFSGFGLGTILTPVFIILFKDIPLAIGATAIVHITNTIFKFGLMRNAINWRVGWSFALTAFLGSISGAFLLQQISNAVLFSTPFLHIEIKWLNLILGMTLLFFTLLELFDSQLLKKNPPGPVTGGIITGIMAGLTGHQGALRSAFLQKYGFAKETFIATGIFIALITDAGRIPVYLSRIERSTISEHSLIITLAMLAAIAGALLGKRLLKKITLSWLNQMVSYTILIFSVCLILGWL